MNRTSGVRTDHRGVEDDARVPAIVHVDLDGGDHIYRVHGWSFTAARDRLFESGLRNTLSLLDDAGVRATLFVIAEDVRDPVKRALIEEALARGHEVASHSLTHRHLRGLPPAEKRREVEESRALLERVLGVTVEGFRAPGFSIDRESLELLDEAGYAYDSSLFPGRDPGGDADAPYHPLPGRALLELPMPGHAPLPFPFHASYALVMGLWYLDLGLRRFRRTGAPLVMLLHLTDLAEPLPGAELPGLAARVYTLSHLGAARKRRKCERILETIRDRYRIIDTSGLRSLYADRRSR